MTRVAVVLATAAMWGGLLAASGLAEPQSNTAPTVTAVTAGQETFRAYCASCHGADGKGSGASAQDIKGRLPDLTLLSRTRGGKFPETLVENVIQGNQFVPAHGTKDMPVWGTVFRNSNADPSLARIKIHNLALYIESIQQK